MMAAHRSMILLLALTIPASSAAPQGLGDAAARERARREKQAKAGDAGNSFSDADLERGKPAHAKEAGGAKEKATEPAAPSQPASSSEPESEPTPPPPADPAPSRIPELEARIKALQEKLNPMSGSYIFGPFGSNDPTEEPRAREELQQLEAELAKAREEAAHPAPPPRQEREPAAY
jgi:hypothetical protein